MKALKLIRESILRRFKRASLLPHTVALAVQRKRRHSAAQTRESERLDRLRNPSKYLGK